MWYQTKFDLNWLRIGRDKPFEVVEILIFEVVGLVEIWCGIIYFVMIGHEMYNPKFEQNCLRID